jgi:Flp pilus assembly pilin Flp
LPLDGRREEKLMLTNVAALWRNLRISKAAVTAVEYGLIASVIAVLIVASVRTLGSSVSDTFQRVATVI